MILNFAEERKRIEKIKKKVRPPNENPRRGTKEYADSVIRMIERIDRKMEVWL